MKRNGTINKYKIIHPPSLINLGAIIYNGINKKTNQKIIGYIINFVLCVRFPIFF